MLDPDAKSLVFSTWTDVLDILASALTENDIQFAALQDQGKFKRNLEKFKVKYSLSCEYTEHLKSEHFNFFTLFIGFQMF